MSKRIILTEEEKKEIKKLYNISQEKQLIDEGWLTDIFSFITKKGTNVVKKIYNKITGKNSENVSDDELKKELGNLEDKDKQEIEKEVGYKDGDKQENKKTKKDGKKEKPKKIEENKWVTEERYCYYKDSTYTGYKVHLLFCGNDTTKSSPTTQKYLDNIPKFKNLIFVMTDFRNSISEAKSWISKKFDGEIISIAGFSAGGRVVWPKIGDKEYKLIGLIDPSTGAENSYDKSFDDFGKNTKLVCNWKNWGGYQGIQSRLKEYCSHEKESNGSIICPNEKHHEQLNYFYKKFGSNL
jgi:hypothetical protein